MVELDMRLISHSAGVVGTAAASASRSSSCMKDETLPESTWIIFRPCIKRPGKSNHWHSLLLPAPLQLQPPWLEPLATELLAEVEQELRRAAGGVWGLIHWGELEVLSSPTTTMMVSFEDRKCWMASVLSSLVRKKGRRIS